MQARSGRTAPPDGATTALLAELALAGFPVDRVGALAVRPHDDALPIQVRRRPP